MFTENNTSLSTEDIEPKNKLTIYPNPVVDFLNIQSDFKIKTVEIYNFAGQKVLQGISSTINVSKLSKGVYILKIVDKNGRVQTEKFTKS